MNNMPSFWAKKEEELGRQITVQEVSHSLMVSWDTVNRWKKGLNTRYDEKILGGLCRFFDIPPGPIPFLVYVPDSDTECIHDKA